MARVSTYLNFMGNAEEAFEHYKKVFGTDYAFPPARMGDMPPGPGMPELSDAEKNLVMHVELPILGGHSLMGTDMIESAGHQLRVGNNTTICLEVEDRAEADRLFNELSVDGTEKFGPQDMPWGAYWGTFQDRYHIRWMINCPNQTA